MKLNNRAFSLIELLVVIVIIVVLSTITMIKVVPLVNQASNAAYDEQVRSIIGLSKLYMRSHTNFLPDLGEVYVVTLEELRLSGVISDSDILNPKTKEPMLGCILISNTNSKYVYSYIEDSRCDK